MDKFSLTLVGALLAFLGALCLDGNRLQRVRRSRLHPRTQIGQDDPGRDPASAVLGVALLAASALTGILASVIP